MPLSRTPWVMQKWQFSTTDTVDLHLHGKDNYCGTGSAGKQVVAFGNVSQPVIVMTLSWSFHCAFITCLLPAAGARARAQGSGEPVSSQWHQAEFVSSTPRFKLHDPGLSVEGCATPWRPFPVSTTFWIQRSSEQSREPAQAGECNVFLFHLPLFLSDMVCSWSFT